MTPHIESVYQVDGYGVQRLTLKGRSCWVAFAKLWTDTKIQLTDPTTEKNARLIVALYEYRLDRYHDDIENEE